MKNHESKRYIPGTNPRWNLELPDGYYNSLVDAAGKSYDNGYNFDEKYDEEDYEDDGATAPNPTPESSQSQIEPQGEAPDAPDSTPHSSED